MSAFDERRAQDVQKLRQLAAQAPRRVKLGRISGNPPNGIDLELYFKTAPSRSYPSAIQEVTRLTIALPARYPLVEPKMTIKTPILHPNVYSSGLICLGITWLPSFGLDLLVRRIVQIVIFDPTILNERSPANREALAWYQEALGRHAEAFPTDTGLLTTTTKPEQKMTWSNLLNEPAKKLVSCPGCGTKLSLPAGKRGQVKCPRCSKTFEART